MPELTVTFAQLEVTTHCNFSCFYCAGRAMPQRHMSLEVFSAILGRLPRQGMTVSLQGEGEPLLHPAFWEMVAAVKAAGHRPYTITNGSTIPNPQRVAAEFPEIGISLDTLDAKLAERIGRSPLDRVLRNLDQLLDCMDAQRIVVHTVDMGQPLGSIRRLVSGRGMKHVIQPLQRKDDYRRHYPAVELPGSTGPTAPSSLPSSRRNASLAHASCHYVQRDTMRYFNVDGVEMLCPFIKDVRSYAGLDGLRASFAQGIAPASCSGCAALKFTDVAGIMASHSPGTAPGHAPSQ